MTILRPKSSNGSNFLALGQFSASDFGDMTSINSSPSLLCLQMMQCHFLLHELASRAQNVDFDNYQPSTLRGPNHHLFPSCSPYRFHAQRAETIDTSPMPNNSPLRHQTIATSWDNAIYQRIRRLLLIA